MKQIPDTVCVLSNRKSKAKSVFLKNYSKMEFDININSLLRDTIAKVDSRLHICRSAGFSFPDARMQLFEIINKMGEASAKAQGLSGTITTGRRLETSDHHLYIMKDPEGCSGRGAVIGILKLGRKRLFVYDRHGQQWEMNPLCVLDFYVHESRQRMGCGRRLFDFMLQAEDTAPQHLAVDRPSHKFSSFLAKHYGLKTEIPQVNNFVIFEGFFTKHPEKNFIHNRRNANLAKPADYPSKGRVSPASWQSSNNYNNTTTTIATGNNNNNKGYSHSRAGSSLNNPQMGRPPSSPHTKGAAGLPSVPPRHHTLLQQDNSVKELNLNPRSAQNMNSSGNRSPRGLSDLEMRSISTTSSAGNGNRGANLQLQSTMYSRHQAINPPGPSNPHYTTAQRPPSGLKSNSSSAAASNVRHRPPSGSKNVAAKREQSPPLRQRDGPSRDYQDAFNLHQNYQGRAGHLVVPSDPRVTTTEASATGTTTSSSAPSASQPRNGVPAINTNQPALDSGHSAYSHRGGYYTNPSRYTNDDTSWTVFGVLRKQNYFSARNSGRTRLW
ncbi:uncharacterized protein LOC143289838 [Babylonia areolata]|uniref:uncharacterized protein LOC143289838 n=1 Tax=Babylonia areolata TaxID=304850 RepID=UPI003FCFB1AD